MTSDDRLRELGARIERIALHPEDVRRPLTRLLRPILTAIEWRPKLRVEATQALVEHVRAMLLSGAPLHQNLLDDALDELAHDVSAVEKSCVTTGRAPIAHAACLRRILEVVHRCAHVDSREAGRVVAEIDATMTLVPLALDAEAKLAHAMSASQVRLVELQLGSIDHLLDAARGEGEILARKRRLLEAARQLLLDTSAALPLEKTGLDARRRAIAQEITRIDRIQAMGVDPNVALLHQARQAAASGERQRLHAVLVALDGAAIGRGDVEASRRTGALIDAMWGGVDRRAPEALAESVLRSSRDTFGDDVVRKVCDGYQNARTAPDQGDPVFADVVRDYIAPGRERATLSAALAVDGCFEVGGVLSPTRIEEHETRLRAVSHPTQDLVLLPARDVADLPDAIVDDPRAILLDLAAGKLLSRRFVKEERISRPRTVLRGEVRVFILDGSTSMIGARARMRDALMVAELSTLMRRLERQGRTTRIALFYRYFTQTLTDVFRVDSRPSALAAIADIVGTVREGGTDIQLALASSFELLRQARAFDKELAHAQIVLVTDGEAPIIPDLLEEARQSVGDLPIGFSVIALGCENQALRALVARQRARGERSFYHFIDDESLKAISEGRIDRGAALHLPELPTGSSREQATAIRQLTDSLLDELAALGKRRDVAAIDALELERTARRDAERESGETLPTVGEGERARTEALMRDGRALDRRFARWFPAPEKQPIVTPLPEEGSVERDEVEAVILALATVAEVIEVTSGSPLARRADAIELFERLLPDAGLTPWRYEEILRAQASNLDGALTVVHRAVAPPKVG